ncbi:hypothetical protein B0H14DRAFT_365067 [Mycena olivaceomarginata]|nr:hypothetical protein B0H14DRAFT_365067 [Mycena olivaceomarginata]
MKHARLFPQANQRPQRLSTPLRPRVCVPPYQTGTFPSRKSGTVTPSTPTVRPLCPPLIFHFSAILRAGSSASARPLTLSPRTTCSHPQYCCLKQIGVRKPLSVFRDDPRTMVRASLFQMYVFLAMRTPLLPKAAACMLTTFSSPTSQYAQQDPWQPLLALIEDDQRDSARLQFTAHSHGAPLSTLFQPSSRHTRCSPEDRCCAD